MIKDRGEFLHLILPVRLEKVKLKAFNLTRMALGMLSDDKL